MNKADHVRAARLAGSGERHTCHWPGCNRIVVPALWGCYPHWKMLPPELQRAIWDSYHPGQESTKTPSRAYVEAARAVEAWILANHPPERTLL